ncbi:MAG: fumarylacetoacetate hydrolase family protein, partial [Sphaerochaetaceae bacterium]
GPGQQIVYPPLSKRVDYEAELAIVIGRTASKVSEADANSYILGYTCANDVTARDLQPHEGQWTVAKGFDTFLPLGPVITDEVDPTALKITSRLNGTVCQSSNTRNLIFGCTYLVSYLSHIMTLYPGDVILTGTPSGIGPMQPGDTIEVEIEGIGILRNTVTC